MRNILKCLEFAIITTITLIASINSAKAENIIIKPKISGFFLGEYIYSNYNQSASGYRFAQLKPFDVLCFPRAVFNMQANVDDNASINLFMGFNFRSSCCYGNKNDPWSFTQFGVIDHAYVKVKTHQIVRAEMLLGIQYIPYGDYKNNEIPASFTQLLTEVQSPALVVNTFIDKLSVSAFILNSKKAPSTARAVNNFGLQLKYDYDNSNIKLGYLYNIASSVNYIIHSSSAPNVNPLGSTFNKRVSGLAINGYLSLPDEYYAELGFTTALNNFDVQDLNWNDLGAKPGALLAKIGKKIRLFGYKNNLSINYQDSWQALNVRGPNMSRGLPKQRYQFDWFVEPIQDVAVGMHYIVDLAYQKSLRNSNTFILTIGYLFDLSAR